MKSDGQLKLEAHMADCGTCTRANFRVNDFCETGKLLFAEWNPQPIGAQEVEISQEQFDRLVAEGQRRRRNGERN